MIVCDQWASPLSLPAVDRALNRSGPRSPPEARAFQSTALKTFCRATGNKRQIGKFGVRSFPMADEQDRAPNSPEIVVRRLVKETGITEEQARELIFLLGLHWASLLREAKSLAAKR